MTPERGRRSARSRGRVEGLWALMVSALVLGVLVAVGLASFGTATSARGLLFPSPAPTETVPTWRVPPSPAPALAGASALLDTAASPEKKALAAALDPRLTVGRGTVGASVLDGATGQTLYDKSGGEPRVPASNLKILAAAAALTTLGPDATLRTSVVRGAEPNTVVLVGGGDVMLGAGESQPGGILGRAGMVTLAARTAAALTAAPEPGGAAAGPVAVRLDDALFTGPALNPAWAPEDVEAGEIAPLHALALNAARTAPGAGAPRPADSAADAANAFRSALAKALAGSGVAVADGVARAAAPAGAKELASVESATVGEQVGYALRESDNYVAEALARLASHAAGGPASNEGAVAALKAAAARVLGTADGFQLSDACGLAIADRAAPAALAALVRAMAVGPDPRLRAALDGLPVAALDGTLAGRFSGTTAGGAGVVRAKTGTLNTVTALSGYLVDADGRLLVFSFVADGLDPAERAQAVSAFDDAAAALAGCGCRG